LLNVSFIQFEFYNNGVGHLGLQILLLFFVSLEKKIDLSFLYINSLLTI